jgi:hypothetical protein
VAPEPLHLCNLLTRPFRLGCLVGVVVADAAVGLCPKEGAKLRERPTAQSHLSWALALTAAVEDCNASAEENEAGGRSRPLCSAAVLWYLRPRWSAVGMQGCKRQPKPSTIHL